MNILLLIMIVITPLQGMKNTFKQSKEVFKKMHLFSPKAFSNIQQKKISNNVKKNTALDKAQYSTTGSYKLKQIPVEKPNNIKSSFNSKTGFAKGLFRFYSTKPPIDPYAGKSLYELLKNQDPAKRKQFRNTLARIYFEQGTAPNELRMKELNTAMEDLEADHFSTWSETTKSSSSSNSYSSSENLNNADTILNNFEAAFQKAVKNNRYSCDIIIKDGNKIIYNLADVDATNNIDDNIFKNNLYKLTQSSLPKEYNKYKVFDLIELALQQERYGVTKDELKKYISTYKDVINNYHYIESESRFLNRKRNAIVNPIAKLYVFITIDTLTRAPKDRNYHITILEFQTALDALNSTWTKSDFNNLVQYLGLEKNQSRQSYSSRNRQTYGSSHSFWQTLKSFNTGLFWNKIKNLYNHTVLRVSGNYTNNNVTRKFNFRIHFGAILVALGLYKYLTSKDDEVPSFATKSGISVIIPPTYKWSCNDRQFKKQIIELNKTLNGVNVSESIDMQSATNYFKDLIEKIILPNLSKEDINKIFSNEINNYKTFLREGKYNEEKNIFQRKDDSNSTSYLAALYCKELDKYLTEQDNKFLDLVIYLQKIENNPIALNALATIIYNNKKKSSWWRW